jgi:ABC-type glycerol-3-phosphate transport system permease component
LPFGVVMLNGFFADAPLRLICAARVCHLRP